MSIDIVKLIDPKDLLDFSQNFSVTRNYLGDRIFPDMKTQHMKAEFFRLTDSLNLPTMAQVHALDTEAHIGRRPTAEKVKLEKMLIKEKINQSERVQLFLENGGNQDGVVRYVFDDVARLAESVKTRTEVMKCELLQTGKITVKENGVNLAVDYGVPAGNKSFTVDMSTAGADIMGDIQTMVDAAKNNGETITTVITSSKALQRLRQNTAIQTAIYGTVGQGTFVSTARLVEFLKAEFGFDVVIYDERYRYENGKSLATKRYIEEDKFIGLSTMPNATMGVGLWGVTPEEQAAGPWTMKSQAQFITATMWTMPDPVAVWTKASGLFIPAMSNPNGLYIATITY